ncbi:MAG: hypothetical protein HRU15_17500, partial [Planctomycetes bacterium]|nr:hypothetical protein [Planctomycetota bacterium]
NPFEEDPPRLTDLVWVRWQWENGVVSRAQSRSNFIAWESVNSTDGRYHSATENNIRVLDLSGQLSTGAIPTGMQNNGVTPMLQQHFDYFEGQGAMVNSVNADGTSNAGPAGKLAVYDLVDSTYFVSSYPRPCDLFDTASAPWRVRVDDPTYDYHINNAHLHTTIDLGSASSNTVAGAYAVRNQDGKSVNKDRLNLIGCDAVYNGEKYYPSQLQHLFGNVEYFTIELIGRDGEVITATASDESDRLGDNAASIDISGINPLHGNGLAKRPTQVRISYLLHSIKISERDDLDYDDDNDADEELSQAIRDEVADENWATRIEKVRSYKQRALEHGFASILMTQTVQLGF